MHLERGSARTAVLMAAILLIAGVLGFLFLFDDAAPDRFLGSADEAALAKAETGLDPAASAQAAGGGRTERELEQVQTIEATPDLSGLPEETAIPADATGVTGRIIGRDGKPAPEVEVVVEKIVSRKAAAVFGVTVDPGELDTRYLRSGVSDAEGRFTVIDLIPFEDYRVRARTDHGLIGRESGIELFDKVVLDLGDIPLRSGVLVSGQVRSDGGGPISGAEIKFGWSWSQDSIISDDNGDFHSSALFPGNHSIQVEAPGYAMPEAYQREFVDGDRIDDLELVLVRAAPIRGRVVDEAGRGIDEASVNVHRSSQSLFGWYGDATLSAADGSFAFESVSPGKYALNVNKAGYRNEGFPEFEAGGPPQEVRLTRSAIIEGLVVDAGTGQALEPDELRLFWNPPWKQKQGNDEYEPMWGSIDSEIRKDGSFTIGVTQAGSFKVEARAEGYAASLSDPFELKQNGAVSGVLLRLKPGIRMELTVLDRESREPVPSAVVSLHEATGESNQGAAALRQLGYSSGSRSRSGGGAGGGELGRRVARVATGPDGRAEAHSLLPGAYVIEVNKRGYAHTRESGVTIAPGLAPDPIELLMGPGGAVTGRVTNNRGEPEPALKVVASGSRGAQGEAISLESGQYRIEHLNPGRYKLEALLENGQASSFSNLLYLGSGNRKQEQRELTEAEEFPVVVADGKDSSFDLSVVRVDPGSLKGTVLINGAPVSGIQLIASLVDPENRGRFGFNSNLRAKTDAQGNFEFRRLDPGEYSLLVFRTWSSSFGGGQATVNANMQTQVTVDVGLGSLGGVVLDPDSRPVEGARIRLSQDRSAGNFNPFGRNQNTTSGQAGGFSIEELEAGLYDLTVTVQGYRTESLKSVEVVARRNTGPLQIRMQAGGWIKARLIGATAGGAQPDRLRLEFESVDQQVSKSAWVRPDDAGVYWLEVGSVTQGMLTVKTRSRDGQAERVGRVQADLQEGLNAEVSVQLQ